MPREASLRQGLQTMREAMGSDAWFLACGAAQNSLSPEQKQYLQDLALICNFKATSDLPQWLEASERETLRGFLEAQPAIQQTSRYTFQVGDRSMDCNPAVSLPTPPRGLAALESEFVGWLANQGWAMRLFDEALLRTGKTKAAKNDQSVAITAQ